MTATFAELIDREVRHSSDQAGHDAKWDEVIDEILDASSLTDDWDGQGAKAPTPIAIETAFILATTIRKEGVIPPDDYGPDANGVMVLGWHSGETKIVVDVDSTGDFECYRWKRGDKKAERLTIEQ